MAAGDVKLAFGTSTDMTVTNLAGLASSATWVAGWESDAIDNTSNLYEDYIISGLIQVHDDAAPAAGSSIKIWIVPMVSDTAWPDVFDGTQSAETWTDASMRDAVAQMGSSISPAATQNLVYGFAFSVANLFGGICPPKFVIFIAHNTGANLHTSGQVITYQGVYHTVAQS